MVTGTGGGSGAAGSAIGVWSLSNGTITAGGSGTILVNGRGGSGTGGDNHGVYVSGGGTVTSAQGSIVVQGTPGKMTGMGIVVDSAISHTGSDSGIALFTDTIDITTNGAVVAGGNTVLLRPITAGWGIDVGGDDYLRHLRRTSTTVGGIGNEFTQPAFDNNLSTAYTNPGGAGTGVEVTLEPSFVPVNALSLTTHSGDVVNDPASYKLEGKLADGSYRVMSVEDLSLPTARYASNIVHFDNDVVYTTFRLTFPRIKGGNSDILAIAEIQLLSQNVVVNTADVTAPGDTIVGLGSNLSNEKGAIDNDLNSADFHIERRFLNEVFGFEVTPIAGATIVQGVRITIGASQGTFGDLKLEGKRVLQSDCSGRSFRYEVQQYRRL